MEKNLKVRELTKNEKVLLSLLSAVILIWLSYSFVLIPQAEKLQALNAEKIEYQDKIDYMNTTLRKEEAINKEWNLLHTEKQEIVNRYFPTIDQAQIIYLLDDLIENDQVSIVDLNFNRPSYDDIGEFQVKNMDVSIPYKGGYDGILGIVNAIRRSPRKILVDSLSMDRDSEGQLNGNMSLKFYSLEGIAEADSDVIYIDTISDGNKDSPFAEYDDYTVSTYNEDGSISDTSREEGYNSGSFSESGLDSTYGSDGQADIAQVDPYIEEVLLDFESTNNYFLPSQGLVKGSVIQSNKAKSKKSSLRFEYNILAVEDENRAYIDVSRNNIKLNYPPETIGMWLYSYDYSPITLGIGYKGQMGEEEFLPLTEGIGWTGWKYLEASPPSDLSIYPLMLDKIYIEMPKNREDFGVLLMDKLQAKYTRNVDEDGTDNSLTDYIFHVVERGDSVEEISMLYYGTSNYKNEIFKLNEIKAGDILVTGRVLVLKKR